MFAFALASAFVNLAFLLTKMISLFINVFLGTCWHLRRLDWCEEVGEPLMDEVNKWRTIVISQYNTILLTFCFCLHSFQVLVELKNVGL